VQNLTSQGASQEQIGCEDWVSYSKKHVLTARTHTRTHARTHTHHMQQLVTLVQQNTSMHHNALHSHMNHFMLWTIHRQQYKATLFWHLITMPWTCTELTSVFILMWCHSACTPNPKALQNGPCLACMETSTHNLTRTQIWCILECDAVYSCKD
jgi:hypothetical protein